MEKSSRVDDGHFGKYFMRAFSSFLEKSLLDEYSQADFVIYSRGGQGNSSFTYGARSFVVAREDLKTFQIFSSQPSVPKPAAPPEVMTAKHCGHHNDKEKLVKPILVAIFGILIVVAIVVFLVWAILHPAKPRFILQDVTIYAFNLTAPNYLTSNMQITLASRNPNDRIGIYYQKLDVFASYRNQQITLPTLLPRTYQGHKDVTIWSPFLYGNVVPVAPFLEAGLSQDMDAGLVLLNIKVFGQVKWNVGTWTSGRYQIIANCPAYISSSDRNKNILVGPAIKYQLLQTCSVDVSLN
ncbi:hypothetical protein DITRI_Ditri05aG0061800 [Diplodiscus trichospermus]